MGTLLVTLDTTELDSATVKELVEGVRVNAEFVCVSVSERERGVEWSRLGPGSDSVLETGIWGESEWGSAMWAAAAPEPLVLDESPLGVGALGGNAGRVDLFEEALVIISNGSFPAPGDRNALTEGQTHQLRDAMVFAAHVRDHRNVLITGDKKGFVKQGRRERLESLGSTLIRTREEFIAEFCVPRSG
jgi:hypothetical protein